MHQQRDYRLRSTLGHKRSLNLAIQFEERRSRPSSLNDRFQASELSVALPQPGHERPVDRQRLTDRYLSNLSHSALSAHQRERNARATQARFVVATLGNINWNGQRPGCDDRALGNATPLLAKPVPEEGERKIRIRPVVAS